MAVKLRKHYIEDDWSGRSLAHYASMTNITKRRLLERFERLVSRVQESIWHCSHHL